MFPWKKISPHPGHVLLFHTKPAGKRVCFGNEVLVGPFETWKHLEVGEFDVTFESENDNEICCRTLEGLTCLVSARFRFEIPIDERILSDLTQLSPPSKNIQKSIPLEEMRNSMANFCESIIRDKISHLDYISLLSRESLKDHQDFLFRQLLEAIATKGIRLLHGSSVITPLDPVGIRADSHIIELWLNYQRTQEERQLEAEKMKLEYKRRLDEIKATYSLEDKKRELVTLKDQLDIDKRKEELKRDKDAASREIRDEISQWEEKTQLIRIESESMIQRRKVEAESAIKAERDRLALDEKRRILEMIDVEKEIETKRASSNELRYENAQVELRIKGEQSALSASGIRAHAEAEVSGQLLLQKQLIAAAPEMIREAAKPISGINDLHVIVVDKSGSSSEDSYLKGLTALPLINSILSSVRSWLDADGSKPETKGGRKDTL